MAAGGSPSTEPKLPCPSTSGYLREKGCPIRTMASYAAESPWGWYFPRTSPTTVADFLCGLLKVRPSSCMANMICLWTGFNPSRTSGSALLTMTDME